MMFEKLTKRMHEYIKCLYYQIIECNTYVNMLPRDPYEESRALSYILLYFSILRSQDRKLISYYVSVHRIRDAINEDKELSEVLTCVNFLTLLKCIRPYDCIDPRMYERFFNSTSSSQKINTIRDGIKKLKTVREKLIIGILKEMRHGQNIERRKGAMNWLVANVRNWLSVLIQILDLCTEDEIRYYYKKYMLEDLHAYVRRSIVRGSQKCKSLLPELKRIDVSLRRIRENDS